MALTAWDEQQEFRDYLAGLAYSGARQAQSRHRIASKGTGETRIATVIPFAATFVEEPIFTSGLTLESGRLIGGAYPVANVGVYKWQIDKRGFWIGAYIWVAVTFGTTQLDNRATNEQAAARLTLSAYQRAQQELLAAENGTASGSVAYLRSLSLLKQQQALNSIQLNHHLVFQGLALRDIDATAVLDD